jgi:hypothetical protein
LEEEISFMILSLKNRIISICFLFLLLLMVTSKMPSLADQGERFHNRGLQNGQMNGSQDHEGEESGGLAALLFGIANSPVVLSILLKTSDRLIPDRMNFKDKIKQVNLRQKKYLMNLHYWVNPLAFGVAISHFMSSECRSTAMPEFGMGAMFFIFILGLMMTLKLSPPSMRKFVFKLHTSPLITILVFSFLLIGHSVIE